MCDPTISDIKAVYKQGKLIPFIGSGFSKPLGLPDWKGLIDDIAKTIGFEPELFSLHGNSQQLLEYIKLYHTTKWKEFIHTMQVNYDSKDAAEKRKASPTHLALSNMDLKTIYTTNYDLHIEECIKAKGKTVKTYTSLDDFTDLDNNTPDIDVIKFHGSLIDDDTIILTESQYFERMSLEAPVDQRLRSDLLSNTFLFMGYSFSDPNIRYIWYKIHNLKRIQNIKRTEGGGLTTKKGRPSYIVTFGNEPIQSQLLKEWEIETITLDPINPTDSLANFLNEINS